MNKNYTKPILSLSLVAVLAFSLSACNSNTKPSPVPTTTTTSSPVPTTTASPTVIPSAPSETAQPPVKGNEIKEAQEVFPNIEVADGVDKLQVQLAMLDAQRYVNGIYNSGYLTNGSWVKNGADSQELVRTFGKDWSDSYRGYIESTIDSMHTGSEEEQNTAAMELLRNMFFFDNSGSLTLPQDCSANNIGVGSCLVDGKLISDGDLTYQVNKDTGSIYVNLPFTANVKFIKDGVPGVSSFHYDIQLEMIKNPYPDEENLRYAYIVNDLGGTLKFDKWHEGEK